jgi:maltose O-acetyltransferase
MTEKDKMLSGQYYDSRDPELLELYHQVREKLKLWAEISSRDAAVKDNMLSQIFGKVGKNVWVEGPFFCDYGVNITIGSGTFVNANAVFLDCNKIEIGENVLIGPSVQIYTASHPLSASERITHDFESDTSRYKTFALPVKIGNKCWIGGGSIILPGVTIGNNVTVAAGSIVTKDIPDNVLVLGSPAAIIKELS